MLVPDGTPLPLDPSSHRAIASPLHTSNDSSSSFNHLGLVPSFDLQFSVPPHARSITLILDRFSHVHNGRKTFGWLDFLPGLFQEAPDNSCLTLTADLFANAYRCQLPDASGSERKIHRLYGNTLKSVNNALADPARSLDDATIIAVWLLGHYEVGNCVAEITNSGPPRSYHQLAVLTGD